MSEETHKDEPVAQHAAQEDGDAANGKPINVKKVRKKWPVVVGVTAVVLVCAVCAGLIWHEQPSFCGTVCHTPMSSYVESYDSEPNTATTDAYGNEVSNSCAMLSVTHKEAGLSCLDCHESNLGQQVNEGVNWVSGNYTYPLYERSTEDLTSAVGNDDSDSFCLKSGCHDSLGISSRDDLVEATSDMNRNPHSDQHGEIDCSECHKAHRASTDYCTQCHSDADADLPDGWVTYDESQAEEHGEY